jgi:hypothetical protein
MAASMYITKFRVDGLGGRETHRNATVDDVDDNVNDVNSSEYDQQALHRYAEAKQHLPQCIIIGVRKGGTRALLEFLDLHPAIRVQKKELHFFDDDQNYSLGLDWYRRQMPPSTADQITVEKTPGYFVSDRVPERIHAMNRSIRLLLIVRDPVDRAISDYAQIHAARLRRGKYHPPFEQLAVDPLTGDVDAAYRAVRRSLYDVDMSRWLRLFRLDQFHFVNGENLVRDPSDELRRVEDFLGLERRINASMFYLNETRGFYCIRGVAGGVAEGVAAAGGDTSRDSERNESRFPLNSQWPDRSQLMTSAMNRSDVSLMVGGAESAAGGTSGGKVEKCLAPSKGRPHPNISARVVHKLRQFFRKHNENFYRQVGINFGWH